MKESLKDLGYIFGIIGNINDILYEPNNGKYFQAHF